MSYFTKDFTDRETNETLKVCSGVNFVGFEIDGKSVILSRAQIMSDLLPHIGKVV